MQPLTQVLAGICALALIFGLPSWALIDALSRPQERWTARGRERAPWVALIIVTGPIGVLAYLVGPRQDLIRGEFTDH